MRMPITVQQLEAFVRVADQASFRKAAEQLHVSQPALSRTIAGAEAALGSRLFDRDTRNVNLTAAGAALLPVAKRVLQEFEVSLGELDQVISGARGRVVVATLPSIGTSLLPTALQTFAQRFPGVEVSIRVTTTGPTLEQVAAGEVDIGICLQPLPDRSFRYEHLTEDEFVLLCASDHPLARKPDCGWADFSAYPYIAQSRNTSIRMLTEGLFQQQGLLVSAKYECESLPLSGRLIAAGLGIAALPRLALDLAQLDGVAVRPLRDPVLRRRLGTVTRAGRTLSTAARNFLQIIRSCVPADGAALLSGSP